MFRNIDKKLRRKTYERQEAERLMMENERLMIQQQNRAQKSEIERLKYEAIKREDQEMTARLEREAFERREFRKKNEEELARQNALANLRQQDEKRRKTEELKSQERRQKKQARLGASTSEAIRDLRHQIKERYQLDCLIWSLKGARSADRTVGEGFMERADSILDEIERVNSWRQEDWTSEEWGKAKIIRERINKGGKRRWKNNPPWAEVVERDEWEI